MACLRPLALEALLIPNPTDKAQAVATLWQRRAQYAVQPQTPCLPPASAVLPGRPAQPLLVAPQHVPQRQLTSPQGLAALLHALAHIEFNAINLALDAIWRFANMPPPFYMDWLKVAAEEAHHFTLLREHLQSLPGQPDYGSLVAHDGLWQMAERTAHDVTARMALVPRTLEARGLDATPPIQAKLRQLGHPAALKAVEILDVIVRDEVGHVAIGNHWYGWLCQQQQLDPLAHYRELARRYRAPRLRPPFNWVAREQAGFMPAELQALQSEANG
jgi:uncharacterized ferritin-like protein (DUF455 family)